MGAYSSKATKHATNDFELVIRSSKELEALLEDEFGATGAGLHEKITYAKAACGVNFSPALEKRMRYLATIRNKLVHERGFDAIPDRDAFIRAFDESLKELQVLVVERRKAKGLPTGESSSGCAIM
jgi:hypothetical protein